MSEFDLYVYIHTDLSGDVNDLRDNYIYLYNDKGRTRDVMKNLFLMNKTGFLNQKSEE